MAQLQKHSLISNIRPQWHNYRNIHWSVILQPGGTNTLYRGCPYRSWWRQDCRGCCRTWGRRSVIQSSCRTCGTKIPHTGRPTSGMRLRSAVPCLPRHVGQMPPCTRSDLPHITVWCTFCVQLPWRYSLRSLKNSLFTACLLAPSPLPFDVPAHSTDTWQGTDWSEGSVSNSEHTEG